MGMIWLTYASISITVTLQSNILSTELIGEPLCSYLVLFEIIAKFPHHTPYKCYSLSSEWCKDWRDKLLCLIKLRCFKHYKLVQFYGKERMWWRQILFFFSLIKNVFIIGEIITNRIYLPYHLDNKKRDGHISQCILRYANKTE